MRFLIILTLLLNSIHILGQENPIDDIISYLNDNRKDLVFNFSIKGSSQEVVLTDSKDNEINSVIIDILLKKGLLNYHSAFLESESTSIDYLNKSRSSVLTIRVDITKSKNKFEPLLIFVPDKKMTENLFNEIETELKQENLFDFN